MRKFRLKVPFGTAMLLIAGSAYGNVITSLYSTGVDASGTPLSNGAAEIHYTIISDPSGGITPVRVATSTNGFPIGPWLGDDLLSAWIGPSPAGDLSGPAGNYDYQTTFDMTGFDLSTASISGQWSMDDAGVNILINGVPIGPASSDFTSWTSFSVNSNFVAGINTLDFVINNGSGPTGLRVEMSGTAESASTGAPEPAPFVLLGAGLTVLGLLRRRA